MTYPFHNVSGFSRWLSWHLAQRWSKVGYLELIALATLSLGLGLVMVINLPLHRQVVESKMQLSLVQAQASKSTPLTNLPIEPIKIKSPEIDFINFFPEQKIDQEQNERLHELIHQNNLQLNQIDYHYERLKPLFLQKTILRINLKGTYESQRKFIYDILSEFPNVAINRIVIENQEGSPSSFTAEFIFYYRIALDKAIPS